MKLDSIKVTCNVKSLRNGVILQVLPVRGVIDHAGLFRGDDGMTIQLTPIYSKNKLYGYSKVKEHKVQNNSHIVQYFVTL